MTHEEERQVLVKHVLQTRVNRGWTHYERIEDIPPGDGWYAIYDGLKVQSCGIRSYLRDKKLSRYAMPILLWLPDVKP